MSFLTRTTPLAARISATSRFAAPRAFSTTIVQRKGPVEVAKDAAKTVDRAVSDKIVDGIELGETATQKVKEVAGLSSAEAQGKAAELSGEAKGKANDFEPFIKSLLIATGCRLAGAAKGKANELKGEAKGAKADLEGRKL